MRRNEPSHLEGDQIFADSASAHSVGSSPRSVGAPGGKGSVSEEPLPVKWDENAFTRVKLMCSYNGRILPRPNDNQLKYVGGETRIVVVSRNVTYGEFTAKLARLFGAPVLVKYQLPSEDLDALISVTSEEDLENMMEEYDRLQVASNRSARLRLFLFPMKLQTSLSDLLESDRNRERWFVEALNGIPLLQRVRSETSSIVSETPDYLSFGLDPHDEWGVAPSYPASNPPEHSSMDKSSATALFGSLLQAPGEISSAPGSPLKRTTASLSTSSAPPVMSSILSAFADQALKGHPAKHAALPEVDSSPVDGRGQVSLPQEGGAQKSAAGEDPLPTSIFMGTAGSVTSPGKKEGSGSAGIIGEPIQRPQAKGSYEQVGESGGSPTARPGSQQRLSDAPPKVQQQPEQTTKPNAASQESEVGIAKLTARVQLLGQDENNQAMGGRKAGEAVKEMRGTEGSWKGKSDEDPRLYLPESLEEERSNVEARAMEGTTQGGLTFTGREAPSASEEEELQMQYFDANSPPIAAALAPVPVPPLAQQVIKLPQAVPFYQLQSSSEEASIGVATTYATQGPAIQLPILRPSTPPPPSPAFVPPPVSTKPSLAPPAPTRLAPAASRSPSPLPRLQTTLSPPPPSSIVIPSSTPVTAYPSSTPLVVEGLPVKSGGIPMHSPFVQLQRQVTDPVPQFQRVPSPHTEHHVPPMYTSSPTAPLPSRFRGRPLAGYQQAQPIASDVKNAVPRPAAVMPSARPPLAPVQYQYYMEQLSAYPPTGVQGAPIYDPINAIYTVGPNNLGGPPSDTISFPGVNPFMVDEIRPIPASDVSNFMRTYQEVLDMPADQQQAPGAAVSGENRLQGRQFVLRNSN